MKYLSVCSGIEAATVAWHGLGWEPVAFAEIEAFPAAVLSHHYPTVPNLGDMTKYREWPEELLADVDLLVGGTPCQAFSVAGLRRSLDDERGNLSLTYVNLYHHINEVRKRHGRSPAIALWENVPGVLSTKDNAFGCFIGGLLGCDEAPETEKGKWDKAGFLSSETVRVGYRVLDAQYFGVAQRRRRVFLAAVPCKLVERFGERACPSEILSLRESVLGNPPTRGAAWEGVARATAAGLTDSGRGVERCGESRGQDDVVIWNASDQANAERLVDQAGTINCNKGQRGGKGGVFGSGRDSQDTFVTCFHPTQDPICSSDGSAHAMGTGSKGGCSSHAVCVTGQRTHALTTRAAACEEDGTVRGTPITPMVMHYDGYNQKASSDVSPSARIGRDSGDCLVTPMAFTTEQTPKFSSDCALTITKQSPTGGGQPQCAMTPMAVRRLTPRECERLQGFPDDYTAIEYRKKPACDGPRYRALGNSMAVPCMRWLGHRIQQATE